MAELNCVADREVRSFSCLSQKKNKPFVITGSKAQIIIILIVFDLLFELLTPIQKKNNDQDCNYDQLLSPNDIVMNRMCCMCDIECFGGLLIDHKYVKHYYYVITKFYEWV
jgi:hypothetical protein